MTQQDKELLLRDLVARLPYGVKIKLGDYDYQVCGYNSEKPLPLKIWYYYRNNSKSLIDVYLEDYRPYLRPMSDMIEEEIKEFYKIENIIPKVGYICPSKDWHFTTNGFDWLNAHYFDYRGLIPLGLAIEVTEENNPYSPYKK